LLLKKAGDYKMLGIRFLTNTCRLKIKTLRRQGYGYPDDDYFFLKLFDASRKGYVRNPVAERIPQDL
jgi:hypothetical protein